MLGMIPNILLAAFAVGMLILVHEVGHLIAAKAVGVRVEIFSLGFGRKLFAFTKGGTEYRLSVVPLGGFVKLAGEMSDPGTGAPDEFSSKSPGQRALVFVAGVVMNMVLAVVGFMAAYAVGVPTDVAEVGELEQGWPAWEAGMREGDRILHINDTPSPDFTDVRRQVALGSRHTVSMTVRRGKEDLHFEIPTRYDKQFGFRRLGFGPPRSALVSGLTRLKEGGRCPAEEAGIEVGDRVVAINGTPVQTMADIGEHLALHPSEAERREGKVAGAQIAVTVERGGRRHTFQLLTEPREKYQTGISGVSALIEHLQGGGLAKQFGFKVGDRILSVNGQEVQGVVEVGLAIEESFGTITFLAQRGGETVEIVGEVPDQEALDDFLFSLHCERSNMMYWIGAGTPAEAAGLRAGDRVLSIGGKDIESWTDILMVNGSFEGEREFRWVRDGEVMSANITPALDQKEPVGAIGCIFGRPKQEVRRFGAWGSIKSGFRKTYATVEEFFLTIRGFVSRDVSTKNVGGPILIAQASYWAAGQGLGKLLYMTAMLSAMIAFINILPIPVLDGGHLLFVAIERVRGKPLNERIRAISQYVGLVLLLALVAYALTNDLIRVFGLG